jgi:hypothetical protein
MDDAMRLVMAPVFFGLLAALFAGLFEVAFLAGTAGVAGTGASRDLEAFEVPDFLAAVFVGVGAAVATKDFLAGAFLPAAFLAAATGTGDAAGARAASGLSATAEEVLVRELIFSASDLFFDPLLRGAAADFAGRGVVVEDGVAGATGPPASFTSPPDSRSEIKKSLIEAPRFFSPCLNHAGFGPRPLQV